MKKSMLIALAVAPLCGSPVLAQWFGCDEATLKEADAVIMKVPDATKQRAARQELELAKETLMKDDKKACIRHLALSFCMMYVDKPMCVAQ